MIRNALLRLSIVTALTSVTFIAQAKDEAEVIHWWTSKGEAAAVKTIADAYNAAGGKWIDTAIAGGSNARTAGINRIVGGNPPTAMQMNFGRQFEDLISSDLIRNVDDLAKAGKWSERLPAAINSAITRNGHVYSVPLNINTQNWLWYNTAAFKKAGVTPPDSFPGILAAAPKLKAAGITPFVLAGDPFYESLLFQTVLANYGGHELYNKILKDHDVKAVRSAGFLKVVKMFLALKPYTDQGNTARSWNDTIALVINGKAAMNIVGDYAKGEFILAGQHPGVEFGCHLLGDGSMIMSGDMFVFPKPVNKQMETSQNKLASIIMEPNVQLAFSMKKGSIPVRKDINVSSMDECAQNSRSTSDDPDLLLGGPYVLLTPDAVGEMQDEITQLWHSAKPSEKDFIEKIATIIKDAS
ncbi:ABC transporter substrate-binding protein [Pantoea vagans]|uniref:ABC transporter substrate-binding protein n=1 Tax=Pantoea vagans TaxID=470934 RepID=UPI00301AE362